MDSVTLYWLTTNDFELESKGPWFDIEEAVAEISDNNWVGDLVATDYPPPIFAETVITFHPKGKK